MDALERIIKQMGTIRDSAHELNTGDAAAHTYVTDCLVRGLVGVTLAVQELAEHVRKLEGAPAEIPVSLQELNILQSLMAGQQIMQFGTEYSLVHKAIVVGEVDAELLNGLHKKGYIDSTRRITNAGCAIADPT